MPQSIENKEYRNFVGGLITDATPISFPENSSKDEDNFEMNIKGDRFRRKGLDKEASATTHLNALLNDSQTEVAALSVHHWKNPSNSSNLELIVQQYGNVMLVYKANSTPMSVLATEILSDTSTEVVWQSIEINGDLLLATGDFCVYRCCYDEASADVTVEKHGLLVRDIWGVDDGAPDSKTFLFGKVIGEIKAGGTHDESAEMGDKRLYNLLNQGWSNKLSVYGEVEPPMIYDYLGVNVVAQALRDHFGIASAIDDYTTFWPNNLMNSSNAYNTSPPSVLLTENEMSANPSGQLSPRGHYILDFFYRGYSRRLVTSGKTLLDNLNNGSEWGEGISGSVKYLIDTMTTEAFNVIVQDSEGDLFTNMLNGEVGTDLLLSDGVSLSSNTGGVNVIASFASRIFYSGFSAELNGSDSKSLGYGDVILFSQSVTGQDKIGKCYQEGDPTSADSFDLVDSDGGFIAIPGVGKITKMIALGEYLLVFSNNGIWAISGGEGLFSATNFLITKVSETVCVSPRSVVVAEDSLYFLSESGIYKVFADKSNLGLIIEIISEGKISSLYKDIPQFSKQYSQGVYDKLNKTLVWIYNDLDSYDGASYRFECNKQLNYNLDLKAFYPYTIGAITQAEGRPPAVTSIFIPPSVNVDSGLVQLYSDGDALFSDGESLLTTQFTPTSNLSTIKYMVTQSHPTIADGGTYFWVCELVNEDFYDWYSFDSAGVDAAAYLQPGEELLGDTQRNKQATYITIHFERTETGFDEGDDYSVENPSGCLVSSYWDFSDHSNSGKVSTPFQAYRLKRWYVPSDSGDGFNYGQSVVSTKSKLRGRGKALSLKFQSEPGKNCIIYGWGITFTGNISP